MSENGIEALIEAMTAEVEASYNAREMGDHGQKSCCLVMVSKVLQVAGEVASISRWHKSLGQEKSAGEVAYSLRSLELGDVASISR